MPELAGLGPIFKSSAPVQLTEEGTEYSVLATKHVAGQALVLQFDCTNTVEEQILEKITVAVDLADAVIPGLPSLPCIPMLPSGESYARSRRLFALCVWTEPVRDITSLTAGL